MKKSVCVIGAGLSGLVCGMRLARKGFEVHIIEELSYPGGLLASSRIGKEYLELLPHHIRKTDRALLSLSRELGISEEINWFDSFWHGLASRKKLGYFTNGFSTLINRLLQEITDNGGTIHFSTTVAEISENGTADKKYCTSCILSNSSRVDFISDYVVFTGSCRSFVNSGYGLPISINVKDQLMNITYRAEFCLLMVLKSKSSDVYFQKTPEGVPFSRIVNHSNSFGLRAYGGNVVYLVGNCSISDPLWVEDDAKIKDVYFQAYRKLFPGSTKADIKAWRLTKIRYAVAERFPDSDLTEPCENVFICSSALVSTNTNQLPENRMDGVISLANKICDKIITNSQSEETTNEQ
ncbi:MAG: FAD-dependent oxidoreductase [Clostridiales bacterium]|nr:FAD-dependent oxidoreductase [Clostridiales bacterium]